MSELTRRNEKENHNNRDAKSKQTINLTFKLLRVCYIAGIKCRQSFAKLFIKVQLNDFTLRNVNVQKVHLFKSKNDRKK